MKWKGLIMTACLLSSILLFAYYPKVNNLEKESLILDAVLKYLDALHFQPLDLDDSFSTKAFDYYIKSMDPSKRFLLQSEIDQLSIHRNQIDNQIKLKNFDFFNTSIEIIDVSRERVKRVFEEVLASDMDQNLNETIIMDGEKRDYAETEAELTKLWTKLVRYDYNNRLKNALDKQEEDKKSYAEKAEQEEPYEEKSIDEIKSEIKDKIKETYEDWFKRMDKDKRSDRFEMYINSLTHVFDPHTDFYNPKEKADFDIRMGGKLEGIGARLQTDGDYTKVTSIIPGGPAWKGKQLEVDDLITGVTQKGDEPLDITGMRLDDVVSKIRGKKGTVVILAVKKVDGSIVDIEIERDEVIIDEGFARSLILDIPEVVENVGYIKLPKFYSSFEKKDGNSCALDVAAEIQKLNDLDVSAVVLDLRYNGGGSLQDVVDMTGLFIEEGPIVQVKPRSKAPYVHEDTDKAVQYDGPLVIMVNQFSASASEILAAALQDYNRAVIVGSNSTFGKGTVQRFVNLDRAYRGNEEMKPIGDLKISMQKFFRVNGGSTQLKGVTPDIILPDNYHYIETGEKDYDHAMAWSEIEPVPYSQSIYNLPDVQMLKNKSEDRIGQKEDFQMILENAARLKKNRDESEYPLDFDAFSSIVDSRDEEAKKYADLMDDEIEHLKIKNLAVDTSYINSDESRVARNEDWLEGVSKDFYIEETLYIVRDMIEMGNIASTKK